MYYSTCVILHSDAHTLTHIIGSVSHVCLCTLLIITRFHLASVSVNLIALVIYDYALTLNREIDYIWLSKWNLIKATFLAQRYLPFLDLILFRIICTFHNPVLSVSALLFSLKRSVQAAQFRAVLWASSRAFRL
jgi:hypothetical protein